MKHWFRPFRRLQMQLMLWTILPLTLVLIGVAFTGVYGHERSMRSMVEERDSALARLHANQISDLLADREDVLHTLSHQAISQVPDAEGVSYFDGGVAVRTGGKWSLEPGAAVWASRWDRMEAMAAEVGKRREAVYSAAFLDTTLEMQTILIGVPGEDDQVLIGAVSLLRLGVSDQLGRVSVAEGIVYIIDEQGCVLAHQDESRIGEDLSSHSGVQKALAGNNGVSQCESPQSQQMILSYAAVNGTGWRVVVEESIENLTAPILRLPRLVPIVAGLAIAVALLAIYFGVRYVARPLQTLAARAQSVTWGDFSAIQGDIEGVEEIEELLSALQDMASRVQDYQSGMRDYIAAITQGQEAERARLARELHDETAQALIALGQRVQMTQRALARGESDRATALLTELREMAQQTVEGVRRFSRDLRPTYLEELGFIPALEMLVRGLTEQGFAAELRVQGTQQRLAAPLELAAYRIAQEALNNSVKHGQAQKMMLDIRFSTSSLELILEDDGIGFAVPDQPDELVQLGRFGLLGMRERAILLGGQLRIRSTPGKGTSVQATFPIALAASDLESE